CARLSPPGSWETVTLRGSARPISRDLHAPHVSPVRPGIIHRQVLDRSIVPEGDRALGPAETAGEFRPVAVLEEEVEERRAFRLGHALEAHGIGLVDEQELPPGLGMRAD